MLFALFFGAGNLIFPVFLGQNAGANTVWAAIGFLVTGVGLPLLGIVAMCYSGSESVQELAGRVHPVYGVIFSVMLYLAIGPCFAIPRTGTVTFEMAVAPFLSTDMKETGLYIFAFLFFLVSWWFAITPSKLVGRIGKIITPALLFFLAILFIQTVISPMGSWQAPTKNYADPVQALAQGFLDGYNTLDALASLAFAILVVQAVRLYGAKNEVETALSTLRSGFVAALCLGIIYIFLCNLGAESVSAIGMQENGAPVLVKSSQFYFGAFGVALQGIIVFLACFTTSVGLITSCSMYFHSLCPKFSQKTWATIFAVISFGVALFGLTTIIVSAIPVLMFLYPLTISLMVLTFLHKLFGGSRTVYMTTTLLTLIPAFYDGLHTAKISLGSVDQLMAAMPLYDYGLTWVPFSLFGLIVGWLMTLVVPSKETK